MFKVDDTNKRISITRCDTGYTTFGVDDENFHPSAGDRLTFSVGNNYDDPPIFSITNVMDDSEDAFWQVSFKPEHTKNLAYGKYVFDVELEIVSNGEVVDRDTIIGKDDEIKPTFVVWPEVTKE